MAETQGKLYRRKDIGDNKGSLGSVLICFVVAVITILALGACVEPTPTVDVAQYVEATSTSAAATSEAAVTPTPALTSTPTLASTPMNALAPNPTPTLSIYEQIPPRGEYDHEGIKVTEEYDRVDKHTEVSLVQHGGFASLPTENIDVFYVYKDQVPAIPDTIYFSFWSETEDWAYLYCHSVSFLVDDTVRFSPIADRDGWVKNGYVSECISVCFTPEQFLQIVNAEKVEARVCNDEGTFTQEQMEALRDLASRMQE